MKQDWISITDALPDSGKYVSLSFENFSLPLVGKFEMHECNEGNFYIGDDLEPCSAHNLFVNAWMPLPAPHRGK